MVQDAIQVMFYRLPKFKYPVCSVSGESDSDIMIDLIERVSPHNVKYTYMGMQLRHLFGANPKDLLRESTRDDIMKQN